MITAMRSIFRIFTLLLLCTFGSMNAQEQDSIKFSLHHFNRIQLDPEFSLLTALGDGFLNDAYELDIGTGLTSDFYLHKNWYVGTRFLNINTRVEKPEKIGDIQSTRIFTFGVQGAYVHQFNKRLYLDLIAGIGTTGYYHDSKFGTNFRDSATSFWAGPKISYRINNFFGIFLGSEIRRDFMNIAVSSQLEEYFGNANLLSLRAGVRFITH